MRVSDEVIGIDRCLLRLAYGFKLLTRLVDGRGLVKPDNRFINPYEFINLEEQGYVQTFYTLQWNMWN